MAVYQEHDASIANLNYFGAQVSTGITLDTDSQAYANQRQFIGLDVRAITENTVSGNFSFSITSVATSVGGNAVFMGTITGGASNAYAGQFFTVLGFTNFTNNVFNAECIASTATTLTLSGVTTVAETPASAATAFLQQINQINGLRLYVGNENACNITVLTGILNFLPSIQADSMVGSFIGYRMDAPAGGGSIYTAVGMYAGTSFNNLAYVNTEIGLWAIGDSNPTVIGHAILSEGKTSCLLAEDTANGVEGSFIGHGTFAEGGGYKLHDGWYGSTGSPNGSVSANVGSIYSRQDGGVGTSLWVKESGSGNTGWAAVVTSDSLSAVTSFSAGNCNPLFTTSVANPTTTPALSFSLDPAAPNTFLAGPEFGSTSALPTYRNIETPDLPLGGTWDFMGILSGNVTFSGQPDFQEQPIFPALDSAGLGGYIPGVGEGLMSALISNANDENFNITANRIYVMQFTLPYAITVDHLTWYLVTAPSATITVDFGICNSSGTVVATLGGVSLTSTTGTGAKSQAPSQGSVLLQPGVYYLMWCTSAANATVNIACIPSSEGEFWQAAVNANGNRWGYSATAATAGVIPGSINVSTSFTIQTTTTYPPALILEA